MAAIDFEAFDADNHYYEALDAFTRHIEPEFAKRTMQWATINGRQRLLVGGKINRFIPNPTFDPVSKPGALDEYFRGRNTAGAGIRDLFGELDPISPAYRDRDARLEVMDAQHLQGAFFFPTLGVGMEQSLIDDPPALMAAFRAFNRWLRRGLGLRLQGAHLRRTVHHPGRRGQRGGRARAGPRPRRPGRAHPGRARSSPRPAATARPIRSTTRSGPGSTRPASPWPCTAATRPTASTSRPGASPPRWRPSARTRCAACCPTTRSTTRSRPCWPTSSSHRFPNLRVATIELGSDWAVHLFQKLKKSFGQAPHAYPEDPRDTFRRHVWVSPYYEDELGGLKDMIGADHILMGSDWPHAEGLADPVVLHRRPPPLRLHRRRGPAGHARERPVAHPAPGGRHRLTLSTAPA